MEGVSPPNLGPIWAQRPRCGITERLLAIGAAATSTPARMSSTANLWRKVEVDGPESRLTAQPPEAIRVQLGAYGLPEPGSRALLYKHAMFSANS